MNYSCKLCWLTIVLAGAATFACKKAVQVDLNSVSSKIVIEGEVTNRKGPYQVKISKTVDFSANNSFPAVSGANVLIGDANTGQVFKLYEAAATGIYSTNSFTGVPLHTYILQVVTTDGQVYIAQSTMPSAVPLDSISFARNTDLSNKKSINAIVYFQDPPGLGNYYQFTEVLNGRQLPDIFVFEDRLSDGRAIQDPLFNDSAYLQKGDTLALKMYCIDQHVYNYFFSLAAVTSNDNGIQSTTPANPTSNLSNGALGYFSAHTVAEGTVVVY